MGLFDEAKSIGGAAFGTTPNEHVTLINREIKKIKQQWNNKEIDEITYHRQIIALNEEKLQYTPLIKPDETANVMKLIENRKRALAQLEVKQTTEIAKLPTTRIDTVGIGTQKIPMNNTIIMIGLAFVGIALIMIFKPFKK